MDGLGAEVTSPVACSEESMRSRSSFRDRQGAGPYANCMEAVVDMAPDEVLPVSPIQAAETMTDSIIEIETALFGAHEQALQQIERQEK